MSGEIFQHRKPKRISIEYDDRSRAKLDHGLVCRFSSEDGKTYAADYDLIGLDERDLVPLAHSIIRLGERLLHLGEVR